MKSTSLYLVFSVGLIFTAIAIATRPDPFSQEEDEGELGPAPAFYIPGFGPVFGGGYGGGWYGGPGGGGSSGGIVRPVITCTEKGPCYNKQLQCPAKCFTSYSGSGKGFGFGGGGGGCSMDCKQNCTAYC